MAYCRGKVIKNIEIKINIELPCILRELAKYIDNNHYRDRTITIETAILSVI